MFGSYRELSREAKYLTVQAMLPSVAIGLLYTDISFFLTSIQGLSYAFMGLVITTMGIATFTASVPMGIAADRYGRKKTLIFGNLIVGLTIIVFALTANPAVLLVAAVFEGISEAAFSASSGALLMEKAEPQKRNSVFSLYAFAQSLAYGIGGLVIQGVVVFRVFGFSDKESHALLYATVAVLSLLSTLMLVKITESYRSKRVQEQTEHKKERHRQSRAVLAKYSLTSAIIAVGAGMVVPLMTAWLYKQYGIPDVVSGPILGLVSMGIGVATLAAPFMAKKLGLIKAIVMTQALSAFFMFATPLSASYIVASSVYAVRAILMNMASPLSQSMIMGLIDEDERGLASGLNAALWRLPSALSTFIGAYLMATGLLALPFFLASALYSLSIALFWFYFRRTKMPEEKT